MSATSWGLVTCRRSWWRSMTSRKTARQERVGLEVVAENIAEVPIQKVTPPSPRIMSTAAFCRRTRLLRRSKAGSTWPRPPTWGYASSPRPDPGLRCTRHLAAAARPQSGRGRRGDALCGTSARAGRCRKVRDWIHSSAGSWSGRTPGPLQRPLRRCTRQALRMSDHQVRTFTKISHVCNTRL